MSFCQSSDLSRKTGVKKQQTSRFPRIRGALPPLPAAAHSPRPCFPFLPSWVTWVASSVRFCHWDASSSLGDASPGRRGLPMGLSITSSLLDPNLSQQQAAPQLPAAADLRACVELDRADSLGKAKVRCCSSCFRAWGKLRGGGCAPCFGVRGIDNGHDSHFTSQSPPPLTLNI